MRLSLRTKLDVAIAPQAINNTNVTSRYFDGASAEFFLAWLTMGAMAATKDCKLEILQATSEAGAGAKALTGSDATATAGAAATESTITLGTVLAGDVVTINGITFTAHATVTSAALRQFSISGSDTADGDALAGLINDATYGVPNVIASNNAGAITLRSADGTTTITVTGAAATITPANTKGQIIVEFTPANLDSKNGFRWVAAKVTTTANGVFAVNMLRSGSRNSPAQSVGASKILI